jgi:Arm DNA-binding domain
MANKPKLITTVVDRLKPGMYWDTQMPGLGVRVSDKGMRTWFYKRRVKGSGIERNVSLGRQGDPVLVNDTLRSFSFGADDARAKAATVQALMLAGVDPVQREKDAAAAAEVKAAAQKVQSTTLQTVVTTYLNDHRTKHGPLRPKTKRDYKDFMDRNFADWLTQPVATINRSMCDARVREIEAKSPIQAHKGRVYLRMFLNSARTEAGDPILPVNPVKLMKTKTHAAKPKPRRVPVPKIGAVFSMLRARSANPSKELDRTAADFVTTLLLTGWRSTECAALEWSWINFAAKTVTLPGDVDFTAANQF